MNDLEHLEILEGVQQLNREPPYQIVVEPLEIVDLEELKQIHAQQFKTDAEMLPEDDVVLQVHHVHDVFWVVLFQELQNL